MKKIVLFFVSLTAIFCLFAFGANAFEEYGTCGENSYFTFDKSTGVLTVSGTGKAYLRSSLEFEDYLQEIASNNEVKRIVVEEGITELFTNDTFNACEYVELPNSLEALSGWRFLDAYSLKEMYIPKNCQLLGRKPEEGFIVNNYSLEKIVVDKDNPYYTSEDGVLFNKDKTVLIQYPSAKKETEYIIPDSVEIIEKYAFHHNTYINKVVFGKNVTKIMDSAFEECSCRDIEFNEGLEYIEQRAFSFCKIESISIPKTVKLIEYFAFAFTAIKDFEIHSDDVTMMNCCLNDSFNCGDFYQRYIEFVNSVIMNDILIALLDNNSQESFNEYNESMKFIEEFNEEADAFFTEMAELYDEDMNPLLEQPNLKNITIIARNGSTAQKYAEKYGYTFVPLCDEHKLDSGVVTIQADCKNEGEITYSCVNCGQVIKTEKVDVTPHIDENGDGICDICDEKISVDIFSWLTRIVRAIQKFITGIIESVSNLIYNIKN